MEAYICCFFYRVSSFLLRQATTWSTASLDFFQGSVGGKHGTGCFLSPWRSFNYGLHAALPELVSQSGWNHDSLRVMFIW